MDIDEHTAAEYDQDSPDNLEWNRTFTQRKDRDDITNIIKHQAEAHRLIFNSLGL